MTTEPLKIFRKEFMKTGDHTWFAQVGLLSFNLQGAEDGECSGSVNGHFPTTFHSKEQAIAALEQVGRNIAREMLMMAGEMVAEKRAEFSERTIERYPVVFKERDP